MSQNTTSRPRGNLVLGLVLGAIVGVMVIALAWTLLIPSRSATPAPVPSATATATPSRTPTPTPTPTPRPTPTPTASPTASASPSANPEVVTSLPAGSFITVLDSIPKRSASAEQALERAAELGNDQYRAVVLDTDAFSGLTPGYWAVVVPGAASSQEVVEVCESLEIPLGDDCYPRQISG